MQSVFITGIPTSGKSFLANRLSKELGIEVIKADSLRDEMIKDPTLEKWVNFYTNLDEAKYYQTTTCDQQWKNLVSQSEALWPTLLEEFNKKTSRQPCIFEGVNILPHLAKRDLKIEGIVLVGDSYEEILERNKKDPRWGQTDELQEMEAKSFYYCEREWYKKEAESSGYQWFDDSEKASQCLKALISLPRK